MYRVVEYFDLYSDTILHSLIDTIPEYSWDDRIILSEITARSYDMKREPKRIKYEMHGMHKRPKAPKNANTSDDGQK